MESIVLVYIPNILFLEKPVLMVLILLVLMMALVCQNASQQGHYKEDAYRSFENHFT